MSRSPSSPDFEDRNTKSPPPDDDEDDPIVDSYSVFINPPLPENRELVILQFFSKIAQNPTQLPTLDIQDIRLKPKAGMVEVDLPIETGVAYDRAKGIQMGSALQKSMEAKRGGSLGLPGGFGIGGAANRAGGGRKPASDDADLTWQEARRLDKVLRTQTLGGIKSAAEIEPNYMVAVFQGKNMHLTPVSSIINVRPVHHHLDAMAEQEKLARPLPGGAAAATTAAGAKKNAANAIQMTLKGAMDDAGVATETMADRLRAVQAEPWRKMEWYDDCAEESWRAYNESLFVSADSQDGDGAGATEDKKGKGKERAFDAPPPDSGLPELKDKVPRLETKWAELDRLKAVSGQDRPWGC